MNEMKKWLKLFEGKAQKSVFDNIWSATGAEVGTHGNVQVAYERQMSDSQKNKIYDAIHNRTLDGERQMMYIEDDEVDFDGEEVLDLSKVEQGFLLIGDGYRDEAVYQGFVKVEGVWWWCDFVSEGTAQPMKITDKDMAKLFAKLAE